MAGPRHPRTVWNRWLATGLTLAALGMVGFILGIWVDERWGGTGALFFFPGLILTIVAAITLSENPRRRDY